MNLLIVESPSKAKTIEKYLGQGWRVIASVGHVRDLVPENGSVDTNNNFAMKWQIMPQELPGMEGWAGQAGVGTCTPQPARPQC